MKRLLMAVVLLGITGTAWAQASSMTNQAGTLSSRIHVGAVGGVTFGNVTSSAFGGEIGYRIGESMEVFVEAGRMTDVTSSGAVDAAATIGGFLGKLGQGAATWELKSPANFGAFGVRVLFSSGGITPYAAVSVGAANLERKSTFALGGKDVTASLSTLGVQLGKDLLGKSNYMLVTAGGGLRVPMGGAQLDLGLRYGRIFSDPGTDTFRAYAGLGFRF
jgi:hypothetical protein